jgi:hypothetical protein
MFELLGVQETVAAIDTTICVALLTAVIVPWGTARIPPAGGLTAEPPCVPNTIFPTSACVKFASPFGQLIVVLTVKVQS